MTGSGSPLALAVAVDGELPTKVWVALRNVGPDAVRILRNHRPLPVFYSFDLERAEGTSLFIPGAGKADFQAGDLTFLVLEPAESFGFGVDLRDLVDDPDDLLPGAYRLEVTYHNQYGEGVFQGRLDSGPVNLLVTG